MATFAGLVPGLPGRRPLQSEVLNPENARQRGDPFSRPHGGTGVPPPGRLRPAVVLTDCSQGRVQTVVTGSATGRTSAAAPWGNPGHWRAIVTLLPAWPLSGRVQTRRMDHRRRVLLPQHHFAFRLQRTVLASFSNQARRATGQLFAPLPDGLRRPHHRLEQFAPTRV